LHARGCTVLPCTHAPSILWLLVSSLWPSFPGWNLGRLIDQTAHSQSLKPMTLAHKPTQLLNKPTRFGSYALAQLFSFLILFYHAPPFDHWLHPPPVLLFCYFHLFVMHFVLLIILFSASYLIYMCHYHHHLTIVFYFYRMSLDCILSFDVIYSFLYGT